MLHLGEFAAQSQHEIDPWIFTLAADETNMDTMKPSNSYIGR